MGPSPDRHVMGAARAPSILCVQPDRGEQRLLEQALAAYRIVIASTGLAAIRHLHSSTFDAYVLDYRLPPTSGIHLCRHIRRTDPHTPVCFYTDSGSEEQRNRAFKAGASAYVCSSAGPEALCDELRTLLEQAELQSADARAEEERAIQDELERRVLAMRDRASRARALAAGATEQAARARAYARFMASGGTPAHFERWWPQVFSSTAAIHLAENLQAREATNR